VALFLSTPPITTPVTVAQVKAHLRITHEHEDALIMDYIAAAVADVEETIQRALMEQEWTLIVSCFPERGKPLLLERPPVLGIVSVTYRDRDGEEQAMDVEDLTIVNGAPVRVYADAWPSTEPSAPDAVEVVFSAGYGTASDVPAPIRHAILLRIGDLYTHRENTVVGAMVSPTRAAEHLMDRYRWRSGVS
jgi:uncharacterized phiE125 gp8 family phage protein